MKRIGIAASKMAKNNLILYNFFVVLIAFLFSLLIFILAGSSILFALIILGYLINGILPVQFWQEWHDLVLVCMISLSVVMLFFNLYAIGINMRIKLRKS